MNKCRLLHYALCCDLKIVVCQDNSNGIKITANSGAMQSKSNLIKPTSKHRTTADGSGVGDILVLFLCGIHFNDA